MAIEKPVKEPGAGLMLTIDRPAIYVTADQWSTISGRAACMQGDYHLGLTLSAGTKVRYVCHAVGGMVKVLHNGEKIVINPNAIKELRS